MDDGPLLQPTLHVELHLCARSLPSPGTSKKICDGAAEWLRCSWASVTIGQTFHDIDETGFDDVTQTRMIKSITIADYTGPDTDIRNFSTMDNHFDVQAYILHPGPEPSRAVIGDGHQFSQGRILMLPNTTLNSDWDSLVFEDRLPARILRCLVRMTSLMRQADLNLRIFNWNRLCLMHGPPGSGKSTLCRALAQKLSIRLNDQFESALMVEISTNALLSKYFGESGKLIDKTFQQVYDLAADSSTFVVVLIDEVETIAGCRKRATAASECNDGMRATNQLLTALDRIRPLSNVLVLCTSNLLTAIDPAFLDRVDMKQYVPCPSPKAVYNIFRSCLNELIRAGVIDIVHPCPDTNTFSSNAHKEPSQEADTVPAPSKKRKTNRSAKKNSAQDSAPAPAPASAPTPIPSSSADHTIVPYEVMATQHAALHPDSASRRVWALAQKCDGFSGRMLRRLPIQALAMHTWGRSSLNDAVSALGTAIEQELLGRGHKEER